MNWLREPDTEPIPGYRILEQLGRGGFGEVWKCVAPGGLFKAIKFVFGNLNSLDGDAEKAEQEFKALERVKAVRHPFVLSMDRIEVVDGELVIVMELADKSLHDSFEEHQRAGRPGIPRGQLLGFLADAAEGLDHLIEKHNLLHLDVKPKNLFLTADRVKVADFGLVKHLERSNMSGVHGGITPLYAAPETFANKISKHSDQYSLAVVYAELLTGRRPFNGKNIRQLALQHINDAPDLSMLPEADRAAVAKALSKNPADRFPSCGAFVRALAANAVADSGVKATAAVSREVRATMADLDITVVTPPTASTKPHPGDDPASGIGVTATRLDVGTLRPAVLIGVGSFGRRAVQQIRCRLLDRVGDLSQVPSFRFLYIDSDPEAVRKAAHAPPEMALSPDQVLPLPLQPVTGYRRRQLDQVLDWLPREKLYGIPRSLTVNRSRALGRLTFCDNYLKVTARLRHEVEQATHPDAVRQSSNQTGLQPRGRTPSVYVFANAGGGSAGMLLDLGHAVRRTLAKCNLADAPVSAFVFAGTPSDPAAPADELANTFATLTELNHYADPDVTFTAQYGGEGPRVEAAGLPFSATYLLPIRERTVASFRDSVSHLAGYIAQELTTPLGSGLEEFRRKQPSVGRTPFRGFGTFGVWFPRGLLLRSAAKQVCQNILYEWLAPAAVLPPEAEAVVQAVTSDGRLTADAVQGFVASESARGADGNPVEQLRRWGQTVVDQAAGVAKRADAANWAAAVWDQVKEFVGLEPTTDTDSAYRRGRLSRSLDLGVARARAAWVNELTELLRPLDELRGPRLAAAEGAIRHVAGAFEAAATALDARLVRLADERRQAVAAAQAAAGACEGSGSGGFSLFGGRAGKAFRLFADRVRKVLDLRAAEDLTTAAAQFYRRVRGWLDDRQREVGFCREQLTQLFDRLEAPLLLPAGPGYESGPIRFNPGDTTSEQAMQTTLGVSNTARIVLPNGEEQIDVAAARVLEELRPADYTRLLNAIQRMVLDPRGGLAGVCRKSPELKRALLNPMTEHVAGFLAELLPTGDVAEAELSAHGGRDGDLPRRIGSYLSLAAPQAVGAPEDERTFVMVPATEAGYRYAAEVKKVAPKAIVVCVQGQGTDLMFCRDQGYLRTGDLMQLIEPCWEAYAQAVDDPERSPHSRFDVAEWLPLVTQ